MASDLEPLRPDLHWDDSAMRVVWPRGPDNSYLLRRIWETAIDATAKQATGPVLDVACGDATHIAKLRLRGLKSVGLEPSPLMLARARAHIAEHNAEVFLVRGIAETLPFRDCSFDRILCESAIDHFADPGQAMREMARVLMPTGRLIIGVVNYGSLNVRVSRFLYRVARRIRYVPSGRRLFWDDPVPYEHTFECTYSALMRLGRQAFDLQYAYGVSIGWAFPKWGRLLSRLSQQRAEAILSTLDRVAYRIPRFADYVISVWRPKKPVPPAAM